MKGLVDVLVRIDSWGLIGGSLSWDFGWRKFDTIIFLFYSMIIIDCPDTPEQVFVWLSSLN